MSTAAPSISAIDWPESPAVPVSRDWRVWLGASACTAQLLTPHAGIKLVLLSLAAVAVVCILASKSCTLTRRDSFLLGLMVFGLAFIVSPYWTQFGAPGSGIVACILLWGWGVVWSSCFCRPIIHQTLRPITTKRLLLPVGAILVLIWSSMFVPLAWRGDEAFHVERLLRLMDVWLTTPLNWLLPMVGVVVLLVVGPGRRILGGIGAVAVIIALLTLAGWAAGQYEEGLASAAGEEGPFTYALRRYPFLLVWPQLLLSWCARGWSQALATEPALSRLLPALSTVLLVVFWAVKSDGSRELSSRGSALLKIVVPLGFATVPVVLFYSTIPYLEVPLLVLMVWVCVDLDRLIGRAVRGEPVGPAWLALGILPFLKETTVIFCLAVVGCSALFVLREIAKDRSQMRTMLIGWLRLCAVLMLPLLVYMYFRSQGPEVRYKYLFYPANFADPKLYVLMARALWEQFGLLLVLGAVGAVYACRHRPWLALYCVVAMAGYFLFFHGDGHRRGTFEGASLPGYAGYARWNYYMLAPLMALAWQGLVWLASGRRLVFAAVVCCWIASNLWMSPLSLAGNRPAGWGSYIRDTEGYSYPYDQLYAWLRSEQGHGPAAMAVVGRRFSYAVGDDMLSRRNGLNVRVVELLHDHERAGKLQVGEPLGDLVELQGYFEQASIDRPEYIVVHQPVWGPVWPDHRNLEGYVLARSFESGRLRLIVYRRGNSSVGSD